MSVVLLLRIEERSTVTTFQLAIFATYSTPRTVRVSLLDIAVDRNLLVPR